MFATLKRKTDTMTVNEIETIIGENTQFQGVLQGNGNTRVDGTLEGEIKIEGDVIIGEKSIVTGNITAEKILIAGSVTGNVYAKNKLELTTTGKLYGDAKVSLLSICEGAIFKGNSYMESTEKETSQKPTKHKQSEKTV